MLTVVKTRILLIASVCRLCGLIHVYKRTAQIVS